jgi:uncharacterized protein (UPF0216 family)
MKFIQILSTCLIFNIFVLTLSLRVNLRAGNHVHNANNMLDFQDSANNALPSKKSVLEDVIQAKPTSIVSKSNENTRFKERETLDRSKISSKTVERNMESPVIIKATPADSTFEDVKHRVAMDTPQSITNTEAFDAIYKDHKVSRIYKKGLLQR